MAMALCDLMIDEMLMMPYSNWMEKNYWTQDLLWNMQNNQNGVMIVVEDTEEILRQEVEEVEEVGIAVDMDDRTIQNIECSLKTFLHRQAGRISRIFSVKLVKLPLQNVIVREWARELLNSLLPRIWRMLFENLMALSCVASVWSWDVRIPIILVEDPDLVPALVAVEDRQLKEEDLHLEAHLNDEAFQGARKDQDRDRDKRATDQWGEGVKDRVEYKTYLPDKALVNR